DRVCATFATSATQEGQSSGSSTSSHLPPLDTRSTTTPLYQHARTGHLKDRSNAGAPQLIPGIPPISRWLNSSRACYACGTTRRWRSISNVVACVRCHPPADTALVAWEGVDRETTIETQKRRSLMTDLPFHPLADLFPCLRLPTPPAPYQRVGDTGHKR